MEIDNTICIRELGEYIFKQLFNYEYLKKQDKNFEENEWWYEDIVDDFVDFYETKFMTPKYDPQESKIKAQSIAEEIKKQERFLNYQVLGDGSVIFDFDIFHPLFKLRKKMVIEFFI